MRKTGLEVSEKFGTITEAEKFVDRQGRRDVLLVALNSRLGSGRRHQLLRPGKDLLGVHDLRRPLTTGPASPLASVPG